MTVRIFLWLGVFVFANSIYAQSDGTRFTKHENLINWMGNTSYGGWSISMHYDLDGNQQVVSDTTYIVTTVSAAYTTINEGFGMLATHSKGELLAFFSDLDNRLKSMPAETTAENSTHWYSKSKAGVLVGRLDANRNDHYTLYNAAVQKQVKKALAKL